MDKKCAGFGTKVPGLKSGAHREKKQQNILDVSSIETYVDEATCAYDSKLICGWFWN